MKVSLGKLEAWVRDQVKHGDYSDCSEVVRDALRQLKERGKETESLQAAMDQAEESGFQRFSADEWKSLRQLANPRKPK